MTIKFDDLRVPDLVVNCAISNFDLFSFPSRNLIKDLPLLVKIWLLESSIDDNIILGPNLEEFDIVDGQSIGISLASSFKSERVLSNLSINMKSLQVQLVICRDDVCNTLSIPEDLAFARIESDFLSAGVFKLECVGTGSRLDKYRLSGHHSWSDEGMGCHGWLRSSDENCWLALHNVSGLLEILRD